MKKYYLFILSFLGFLTYTSSFSQEVKVKATIDSTKILVGDQVNMKIQISYPAKTIISWPTFKDSLNKHIEIIEQSKIDTLLNDSKTLSLQQTLIITSFDSGSFYVPSVLFKYKKLNDTTQFNAYTDSLLLSVTTLAVDTTKAIKDIKEPLSVPLTFKEVAPFVIGALLLFAIIGGIIWFIRKRKKGEPVIRFAKPSIPPHMEALMALDQLRDKKLWHNNKVKEYYTELSDIIRTYIEKQHRVIAMEMTTDEIITAISPKLGNETILNKLKNLLIMSDLVKFAKANPLPNEHENCLVAAYDFVHTTKPVEIINTEINNHKPIDPLNKQKE